MKKLQKMAEKKGWVNNDDDRRMGEPQGFKSGLRQFQEDQKKNKGLRPPDEGHGGYGGGRYGGRGNDRARDWYNNDNDYRYDKKEPKDERSATEKLFDNRG